MLTDSIHGTFYSAVPLGTQTSGTMLDIPLSKVVTRTELTSYCPILTLQSAILGTILTSVHLVRISWLFEIYILATYRVVTGWVPTCDSAHSLQLYSAAPLGDQVG